MTGQANEPVDSGYQGMKRFFSALFGRGAQAQRGPQVANTTNVNDVLLARSRGNPAPVPAPALRAVRSGPANARLPEEAVEKTREIDFEIDDMSLEQPTENGFDPYDTGRFSASELWEKRHRERVD